MWVADWHGGGLGLPVILWFMLDKWTPKPLGDFFKWLSIRVNVRLLGGEPQQSICARIYEAEGWFEHRLGIRITVFSIDLLFGKNHCKRASALHRKWERQNRPLD